MNGEPEDPFAKARQLRAAGVPLEEIERYLQSRLGGGGITPGHSKFTPEQLVGRANRAVNQSEDELEAAGGYNPTTHKIMGTAASLARDVPGAEAAQAFVSSRANRIPYREALKTIRDVEGDAGLAGTAARIGGGALAAAVIPGSPVVQGARYGIAHGLAQADPATVEDRLHDAAIRGTIGAIAPTLPGLAKRAGRRVVSNAAATIDAGLTPFSHGARVRTAGRLAGLVRESANKAGPSAAGAVSAPLAPPAAAAAPGNLAADEIERRLVAMGVPLAKAQSAAASSATGRASSPLAAAAEREPVRLLPFRAPTAPKSPMEQFSALLQKNLDEGMEAAEQVKGYPIRNDPPSNPELMRRIEEALLRAKSGAPTARATPRKGITTPPRTVADVLKGGRQ